MWHLLDRLRHFAILASVCLLTTACAEIRPAGSADAAAVPLTYLPALRGDYFKFDSTSVGRSFHIYVRLPESYDPRSSIEYPSVYLLDGDSAFPLLAVQHQFLNYDEGIPEAIVVGIAYGSFDPSINKRGYDFSAPAKDATEQQGGAPAFQAFLKSELIPEIERRYRAAPNYRVLVGQSRGGYMVLYSAFTDPDLFWARIASNPGFDPGRELFYSAPAPAARKDLALVVTSSARDSPRGRANALAWFKEWESRTDTSWALNAVTIPYGTHAADFTNSYRIGMVWLFRRQGMLVPTWEQRQNAH